MTGDQDILRELALLLGADGVAAREDAAVADALGGLEFSRPMEQDVMGGTENSVVLELQDLIFSDVLTTDLSALLEADGAEAGPTLDFDIIFDASGALNAEGGASGTGATEGSVAEASHGPLALSLTHPITIVFGDPLDDPPFVT